LRLAITVIIIVFDYPGNKNVIKVKIEPSYIPVSGSFAYPVNYE